MPSVCFYKGGEMMSKMSDESVRHIEEYKRSRKWNPSWSFLCTVILNGRKILCVSDEEAAEYAVDHDAKQRYR